MKKLIFLFLLNSALLFSQETRTLRLTDKDRSMDIMTLIMRLQPYVVRGSEIFFNSNINSINFPSGALIVIDGMRLDTDISNLKTLAVAEIETISVILDAAEIARFTSFANGVIEITTKRSVQQKK